jgi:hypothetical protein
MNQILKPDLRIPDLTPEQLEAASNNKAKSQIKSKIGNNK